MPAKKFNFEGDFAKKFKEPCLYVATATFPSPNTFSDVIGVNSPYSDQNTGKWPLPPEYNVSSMVVFFLRNVVYEVDY